MENHVLNTAELKADIKHDIIEIEKFEIENLFERYYLTIHTQ